MTKKACPICGANAIEGDAVDSSFARFDCGECKRYLISRSLLRDMEDRHQSFDVLKTQKCIQQFVVAGKDPVISVAEFAAHQLAKR